MGERWNRLRLFSTSSTIPLLEARRQTSTSAETNVMQAIAPIDLTSLLAVFMGTSIVLIPVIGLTARFALKPTVEALSKLFQTKGMEETVQILERRMALLETQLESIDTSVSRLADASEFHQKLRAGEDATDG